MTGAKGRDEHRRRRRQGRARSVLLTICCLAVLAVIAGAAVLFAVNARFAAQGPLVEPKTIVIDRGQKVAAIARLLEEQGVISDSLMFIIGVLASGNSSRLKAGEYRIERGASMRQVVDLLIAGKIVMHKVTVAEGLTSQQVIDKLRADEGLVGEIGAVPQEGSLLPDTYSFKRGESRMEVLERMRRAHQKVVDDLWTNRANGLAIKSREEAIVLASIVEKETAVAEERPRVAAVFHNRLRRNMRLQSDPTIIYGIVGGKGRLDRPITRSDIARKTAYNTYQIDGLPPTPIANPGRAAIEAVLAPAKTNDLFFVADGTGGHAFAETEKEHLQNVAQWRQIERERQQAAAAAAQQAAAAAAADPALPDAQPAKAGTGLPVPAATGLTMPQQPTGAPTTPQPANPAAAQPVAAAADVIPPAAPQQGSGGTIGVRQSVPAQQPVADEPPTPEINPPTATPARPPSATAAPAPVRVDGRAPAQPESAVPGRGSALPARPPAVAVGAAPVIGADPPAAPVRGVEVPSRVPPAAEPGTPAVARSAATPVPAPAAPAGGAQTSDPPAVAAKMRPVPKPVPKPPVPAPAAAGQPAQVPVSPPAAAGEPTQLLVPGLPATNGSGQPSPAGPSGKAAPEERPQGAVEPVHPAARAARFEAPLPRAALPGA